MYFSQYNNNYIQVYKIIKIKTINGHIVPELDSSTNDMQCNLNTKILRKYTIVYYTTLT